MNQVVDYLKKNVEGGIWRPGEKISSENELTATLQVSRASIRAAIQHLVAVGVLESYQGKGTYVKAIPLDEIERKVEKIYINSDIEQLLEYRQMVEVESCRLAARRITEESLKLMEEYLQLMEKNMDVSEVFIENDMAFHKEILKATGNRIIVKTMDVIRQEIERQHWKFNTMEGVQAAVYYHRLILEQLSSGDGKGAAKSMSKHLEKLQIDYYQ